MNRVPPTRTRGDTKKKTPPSAACVAPFLTQLSVYCLAPTHGGPVIDSNIV